MNVAYGRAGAVAYTQLVTNGTEKTWTVLDHEYRQVVPVESYLEYMRTTDYSPNTIKSYSRALALWWTFLEARSADWTAVGISDVAAFVGQVRSGEVGVSGTIGARPVSTASDSTVAVRVRAVGSFYKFHASSGVDVAEALFETAHARPSRYLPFLEHIARKEGRQRSRVRIKVKPKPLPILTPPQSTALKNTEATWDGASSTWEGELRYRLLWSLLEETGLRLGEALMLRHGDWQTGTGTTGMIIVGSHNDHPHGLRAKSGYRRVHIGSDLDRLYGDYVWQLCEAGAEREIQDWDRAFIFCNLRRGTRYSPLRPESVYKHLRSRKKQLPEFPHNMNPHWFRHTHATGLLLAGVPMHVVSRRLGHADIQTTINTYAHVTEDAELRACADWAAITKTWGTPA